MNWQYLIIGILFLVAIYFLWQKVVIPFNSKKNSGCGKGCGCGVDLEEIESRKK